MILPKSMLSKSFLLQAPLAPPLQSSKLPADPKQRKYRYVGALFALGTAIFLFVGYPLHRRTLPSLSQAPATPTVGALHIHSADSHDSNVTIEAIVDAARENHLDFVILTDHNKQKPKSLSINGVTVLSSAELSTPFGHVIQLGATYTLDSTLRDTPLIHQNIRAAGGRPIIAHPSDRKRPWSGPLADASGLEIANLAAATRRAARPFFLGLLPHWAAWSLNPQWVLAQLYDRDDEALKLWDAQVDPQFVGTCGSDTHGWIPVDLNLRAWYLVIDAPLPAHELRPAAIVSHLQQGHFHCVAGLLGHHPDFRFGARHRNAWSGGPGDSLPHTQVEELLVKGPSLNGLPSQIVLLRDGAEVSRSVSPTLTYPHPTAGTYRAEVYAKVPNLLWGSHSVPVIYSNKLRVLPAASEPGS